MVVKSVSVQGLRGFLERTSLSVVGWAVSTRSLPGMPMLQLSVEYKLGGLSGNLYNSNDDSGTLKAFPQTSSITSHGISAENGIPTTGTTSGSPTDESGEGIGLPISDSTYGLQVPFETPGR
jgi:hypothetical protein